MIQTFCQNCGRTVIFEPEPYELNYPNVICSSCSKNIKSKERDKKINKILKKKKFWEFWK